MCNDIEIMMVFFVKTIINVKIAKQLEKRWNFQHCIGAIKGKQIVIYKRDGRSRYLNCKNTPSILSLAAAEPDYEYADFVANCDDDGI